MIRPTYLNAKVRIRSDKFANFLEYYHSNSNADSFKETLNKIIYDHTTICKITPESFKSPVSSEGFYFKLLPQTKCKNLSNKTCIIDDIYESDAYCKFKIQPYDFMAKGVRIVGITITLINATAKFDKNDT